MSLTINPIGIIHSPYKELGMIPFQAAAAEDVQGWIELDADYVEGLKDLEGFSHILLLFQFHQSDGYSLTVNPPFKTGSHGVFATRAPKRPNPIGLSIVKLLSIEGNRITFQKVDMLDGTPLLDIKPYVPGFDQQTDVRFGWLENAQKVGWDERSNG